MPTFIKDKSEIPKGAVRVHLYDFKNVLMPRGSMEKESIGAYILERLISSFEDWTDEDFGDNPQVPVLMNFMQYNLREEMEQAWERFYDHVQSM